MASDLETDPHDVKTMISVMQGDSSVDVVTASRWKDGILVVMEPIELYIIIVSINYLHFVLHKFD